MVVALFERKRLRDFVQVYIPVLMLRSGEMQETWRNHGTAEGCESKQIEVSMMEGSAEDV